MRASRDWLADDGDAIRISDADRDLAVGELRASFAEGRLSHETFLHRMDVALQAKARSELADLFVDLPRAGRPPRRWRRPAGGLGNAGGNGALGLRQRAGARLSAALRRMTSRHQRRPVLPAGQQAARNQADPRPLRLPPVPDGRFTIGRAAACDFTVPDESVSRWHARLERSDGGWLLCDLRSTNGTRLNGWRVTSSVPVQPGDHITFGLVTFVVTDRPATTAQD
jgi:hypothetical protein